MAKNQPKYFSPESTEFSELRELYERGPGFFPIGTSEIPTVIPAGLRAKWVRADVINSPTANAMAIVGYRIDWKDGKLDQDPFLIGVSESMPRGRGVLMHHANYAGRSSTLPSSSIKPGCYKDNPSSGLSSGSTDQLPQHLFNAFRLTQTALSSASAST